MEAISPFIAGSAAVVILSLSIYLVLNLVSTSSTQTRALEGRVRSLERDNRRCERRLNIVIDACNRAEPPVLIPATVWTINGDEDEEQVQVDLVRGPRWPRRGEG